MDMTGVRTARIRAYRRARAVQTGLLIERCLCQDWPMRYGLLLLPLILGAGAASPVGASSADTKRITAAQPVGEAVSCVQITRIRSTHILSDSIIDFELSD